MDLTLREKLAKSAALKGCDHKGEQSILGQNGFGLLEVLCHDCGAHVGLETSFDMDSAWFVTLHPADDHDYWTRSAASWQVQS